MSEEQRLFLEPEEPEASRSAEGIDKRWTDLFQMIQRAQAGIPGASEQALVAVRFIAEELQQRTGDALAAEPSIEWFEKRCAWYAQQVLKLEQERDEDRGLMKALERRLAASAQREQELTKERDTLLGSVETHKRIADRYKYASTREDELLSELEEVDKRGAQLQEALRTYGRHEYFCPQNGGEPEDVICTCGLDALLARPDGPHEKWTAEEIADIKQRAHVRAKALGIQECAPDCELCGDDALAARPEGNEPHYEESHGVWLARHHGHRIERRADYDECLEDGATYWGARPDGPQE